MKTHFNKLKLASGFSALAFMVGVTSVNAAQINGSSATLSATQPTAVMDLAGQTDGLFIVRLTDPAVATYSGGIAGYEATSAKARGDERLNTNSAAAKKYEQRLKAKQDSMLAAASTQFGRDLQAKYNYQHALNGFAVALTHDEAKALRNVAGIASVQRERQEYLLTDVGPAWINAPAIWNAPGPKGSQGEDQVIAVFDSGINSQHPSFAAVGGDGHVHTNPLGSGNFIPGSYCDVVDPTFCNDKLIGAWDMTGPDDGTSPEDTDGHGSHTASTAGGNVVLGAQLDAPTTTASFDISGVAPHANIIAYDVCIDSCPGSALVAAVNQIVIDAGNLPNGIAALNYSISGGGNPYSDPVELGFLAAVEAGIYVSASAGNSGPAASTVAHLGPWVATTAASTHNRSIGNSLINISSDGAALANRNGSSFSAGYGPAPIIHANTIASDPEGQCLTPFAPGTFNGEIVMCDRGSIARTEKGQNVLAGGAGGYVLGNLGQGDATVADAHFLPAVHLGDTLGGELRDYLAANTNAVATITPFAFDLAEANGDIMGGFSSRGPQLAFDVMKPDLTAPGVDIMGADAVAFGDYQIISGTSMSSPHNAGAGALMTAVHPDWTPAEIKSAIMMTGVTANTFKEDGVTPTDPFDLGGGRVDLKAATKAGLVMSETGANFLAADPALGGDPSTLNLASMMNSTCVGTCSWTRTVTNKTKKNSFWIIEAQADGFDVDVEIDGPPNSLWTFYGHWGSVKRLKLKKGQSADITVTATNFKSADGWLFGALTLDPNKPPKAGKTGKNPVLSMPIAVQKATATDANLFTKSVDAATAISGDTLSYEISTTNGQVAGPITVSDELPAGTTFVAGSENEVVVLGTTSSPLTYDAGSNTVSWTGELDAGALDIGSFGGFFAGQYISLPGLLGATPITLPTDCDDGGLIFNVPGGFTYNGVSHSEVIWSVNGTVEAGSASGQATSFANQLLPDSTPPNNILAPYWRDLNACAGGNVYVTDVAFGGGAIVYTIFEWEDVPYFGTTNSASFQVWLRNDGTPTSFAPVIFSYNRLDNDENETTIIEGTVGAENIDGSVGVTTFFDGQGLVPEVGIDLGVFETPGGSATLGFQVVTDCSEELVINEANLSNVDRSERAIAVTACQPE